MHPKRVGKPLLIFSSDNYSPNEKWFNCFCMVSFVPESPWPECGLSEKKSLWSFGRGNVVGKSVCTASQVSRLLLQPIFVTALPATVIAAHTVFWWKIIIARRHNRDTIMALDMEMVLGSLMSHKTNVYIWLRFWSSILKWKKNICTFYYFFFTSQWLSSAIWRWR